jgi:HAD superfamily hydrolase (TIGR01509 family)
MNLQALIFDCDGVLADTEKDGHRVAFNMAFSYYNIQVTWEPEQYRSLVKIAGGKERMIYYFDENGWPENYHDKVNLISDLHTYKTNAFMELIASDRLQPRPGVLRLIDEAIAKNIPLAVCSTSNEKSVNMIVKHLIGDKRKPHFHAILAGDVVKKKKPAPDIYLMCRDVLDIDPKKCMVIEDSRNGLLAAKSGGFNCLITKNDYTSDEDFTEADKVVTELGNVPNVQVTLNEIDKLIS